MRQFFVRPSRLLAPLVLLVGVSAVAEAQMRPNAQGQPNAPFQYNRQVRPQSSGAPAIPPAATSPNGYGGHSHQHHGGGFGGTVNNFNFGPGYLGYSGQYYGRPFGGIGYQNFGYSYGNFYGGGNPFGPIIYPPSVTVVAPGLPLTGAMLNGVYGSPVLPYGYGPNGGFAGAAIPQVQPVVPFNGIVGRNAMPAPAAINANPAPVQPLVPQNVPAAEDEIARRVAVLKPSTEAGRSRSDVLIAEADREFAGQKYRPAAQKYRDAIAKAPDYSPGHLRAGHAYTATGDYDLAVNYFAMGFALSRTIERPGFSLNDLYRGDNLAKEQHAEALADAVLRQPGDGSLLFLTGVFQHYNGHPLQARDYFRRAAELPGRHQPYAAMFLPK